MPGHRPGAGTETGQPGGTAAPAGAGWIYRSPTRQNHLHRRRGLGQQRPLRPAGGRFTLDDLLAVLSGKKEHTPRKQPAPQTVPPKVNLLVDIQDKLKAGKGDGYARWAKVFNLKQMAQTLNYLSEHGLLDYADLEAKTTEATAPN